MFLFLCSPLTKHSVAQENPHKNAETAQEMYDSIMSPYCPGRTLSACPSDDARKLRERILSQIEQGYSSDAIMRQLQSSFGKEITGTPELKNFGLFAWVIPFIIILICVYIVLIKIRNNKKELEDNNLEQLIDIESKLSQTFHNKE